MQWIHLYYLFSTAVAFIGTHTLNYSINRKWGFKETKEKIARSYIYFLIFRAISFIIILSSAGIVVEFFNVHYMIARFLVAIFVGLFNFSVNYFISFNLGKNFKKELSIFSNNNFTKI
ncbi:hypothetical protein GF386_02200 [Candidatus Pacearchaeota archaeon]|nr:hypothetical protein [Candidatus Pacearchaeota archaeon]MBD3282980.1 hypothetical protein [Candidatus Pacearchaeota archaeon]